MPLALKRALEYFLSLVIGLPMMAVVFGLMLSTITFFCWLVGGGGIIDILHTIVTTVEMGFKHDWKLPEVVLVLIVLFLTVRKR